MKKLSRLGLLMFIWKIAYISALLVVNNGAKLSLSKNGVDYFVLLLGACLFIYLGEE